MNKKGEGGFEPARKAIYWMIAAFVISIVLIAFVFIVTGFRDKIIQVPPELHGNIIASRFANIPECLAYEDPVTFRVYPGMIDMNKFSDEHVKESCYKTDDATGHRDFNFEIILGEKKIRTNNYYNAPNFEIYRPVQVREGDTIADDILLIKVQIEIPFRPSYVEE